MKQTLLYVKVLKQPTIERYTNGSKDGNKIASAAVVNIKVALGVSPQFFFSFEHTVHNHNC